MPRPQKDNLDYFPHENVMRNDRKLKAVRSRWPHNEGYAIYNMILETLSESSMLIIEWNNMESELIAGDFGIESEKLTEMIEYFIKIDLIQSSNGYIYCKQLDKRSECVFGKRTVNLDSLRIENGINITQTIVCDSENTQSKVKERKLSKVEKKGTCISDEIELPIQFKNDEFETSLNHFIDFRKKIKAPLTDYAIKLLINKLSKLSYNDSNLAIDIMQQSMINGWKGVFEIKGNNSGNTRPIATNRPTETRITDL